MNMLDYELEKRYGVRNQVSIPIRYEELTIENGYRLDLLVGDLVIVELKAVPPSCRFIVGSY